MAIVTFVIAAISMGVAIYSAFRAGGLRERGKWYHRAHEAMARDGKSLRSLSSDPGTVTLRIEDVVAMTAVDSMVSADMLRDLVKALRIIDADIGLKNSILAQAKEEGGNYMDDRRISIREACRVVKFLRDVKWGDVLTKDELAAIRANKFKNY